MKRFRAPNFTQNDNLLLCDIVDKYKQIIENKKTDGANLLLKQKAWLEVEKEYNSSTDGCSRTVESLQQNYKNLKKKLKKNASDKSMDLSGGGSECNADTDPVLEKVKILASPVLDGLGVHTIFFEDSSLMSSQNVPSIELNNTGSEGPIKPVLQHTSESGSEDEYYTNNGSSLKNKLQHLWACERKKETKKETVADKFKLLATEKMDLLELQKDLVRTQLQEERDKAEHNRMLRAMELEDLRKKYMHNEKLREMEIEEMKRRNEFNNKNEDPLVMAMGSDSSENM